MKLTPRRALLIFALLVPAAIVMVALALDQWALAAAAATVAVTAVWLISGIALIEARELKRHANQQSKMLRARSKEIHSEFSLLRSSVEELSAVARANLDRTEHAERRLVGIMESLRLESSQGPSTIAGLQRVVQDDLKALGRTLSNKTTSAANSTVTRTVSKLTSIARDETRQVEALLQLIPTIQPVAPLPPSGQWAMDARSLLHLSHLCRERTPKNVVELGSGTSTVWLAYLLRGAGSITSVDHDPEWARLTQAFLERHGLAPEVRLRTAPLHPIDIASSTYSWYPLDAFDDVADIDLLLIDGPPEAPGSLTRYPALPALQDKLARRCTIVLDDSERPDEVRTVERWLEEFEGFTRIDEGVSRLAILTRAG